METGITELYNNHLVK